MNTETKLKRIAWLSSKDKGMKFECLMHHINFETLRGNFLRLDAKKATGIDGVSKIEYGEDLENNLTRLLDELKRMAYKPRPIKEHLIPKDGQPGKFRPLGISVFEDKLVQGAFRQILEAIYEPIFLECSHGFRPKRGCHTAIKDLRKYLYENDIEFVIDIDLKNFFGTINHKILEDFLREKITDEKFIRYIIRMFKAGVLSEGDLVVSDEGVAQGSICSPILSNVFAHKVLDEWIEQTIQPYCKGKVKLFRYADDAIICVEKEHDAIRIREALPKRLEKYKLVLNEEKTKMINFSRAKVQNGIPQGTFNFLGFTFFWGKTRKGRIVPKLKTSSKTMDTKLEKVTAWIKDIKSKIRMKEIWGIFCAKLRGHIQYYGVSFNSGQVEKFLMEATRIIFKGLNRRSQKKSLTWEKFNKFMERYPLPKAHICHSLY
jgi:RNA-directed DNA polymerase